MELKLIFLGVKFLCILSMMIHSYIICNRLFSDYKNIGLGIEYYFEAVLSYLTKMEIFSERRIFNEIRRSRFDHIHMMNTMRIAKQQIPEAEQLLQFKNEEEQIQLDTELLIKIKNLIIDILKNGVKKISIIVIYIFISIFISGIDI